MLSGKREVFFKVSLLIWLLFVILKLNSNAKCQESMESKFIFLITVIVIILLSSFRIKKQKSPVNQTQRPSDAKHPDRRPASPVVQPPQVPPVVVSKSVEEILKVLEQHRIKTQQGTQVKPPPLDRVDRPYIPSTPDEEGVHSVPIPAADDDDAYAEPHADVPVENEWRRAIIAHEILKTKF